MDCLLSSVVCVDQWQSNFSSHQTHYEKIETYFWCLISEFVTSCHLSRDDGEFANHRSLTFWQFIVLVKSRSLYISWYVKFIYDIHYVILTVLHLILSRLSPSPQNRRWENREKMLYRDFFICLVEIEFGDCVDSFVSSQVLQERANLQLAIFTSSKMIV